MDKKDIRLQKWLTDSYVYHKHYLEKEDIVQLLKKINLITKRIDFLYTP